MNVFALHYYAKNWNRVGIPWKDTKKARNKQDYNPLDKFDEEDEFGGFKERKLLAKYDEVVDEKQ